MKTNIDLNDTETAFAYKSNADLKTTLFIYRLIQKPRLVKILTWLANMVLKYKLPFKFLIKNTVFKVFCAGQNRAEVVETMDNLKSKNVNVVLDYVAEGDVSEASFDKNLKTILGNIQFVGKKANQAFVGVKLSGLEDVQKLRNIKLSDLDEGSFYNLNIDNLMKRTDEICALAVELNVKVYIDAEERSNQDVFDFVVETMMEKYNREKVIVYNTLQMYLKDRIDYLNRLIQLAKQKGFLVGLKLVRGAYVEKEREYALAGRYPSPVFETKEETDASFNQAVDICLKEHQLIRTCLATHNQKSIELAIDLIEKYQIDNHNEKVFFSQLFGMSDNLTFNLAKNNYNSSKYVPYGEVEKAIPYLLRRAEENSSIEGQVSREFELLKQEKDRRKI